MKIGDLVMWVGKDNDHGCIGFISEMSTIRAETYYTVMWADGTRGTSLSADDLLMVIDDEVPEW
jgi:hypothetical protein